MYSEEHLQRLSFVQRARNLGFSLAEIQELIGLEQAEGTPCRSARRLAQHHHTIVREKIAELTRIGDRLETLIQQCKDGEPDHCAILDSLTKPPAKSA